MPESQKPSNQEEEYFAREEIEKKRRLALKQAEALASREREDLKRLHYMKCPKCGMDLHALKQGKIEIDTCFNCKGTWLDAGELDQLLKQGHEPKHGLIRAIINFVHPEH